MKKFKILPVLLAALLMYACGDSEPSPKENSYENTKVSEESTTEPTENETEYETNTETASSVTVTTAADGTAQTETSVTETSTVTTAAAETNNEPVTDAVTQKPQEINVSLPSVSGTVNGDGSNFTLVLSGDFAYAKVTLFNSTNNTNTDAGQFSNDGNPILLPVDSDGTWYVYIIPYSSEGTEGLTATIEFIRETQQPQQQEVVQPVQDTSWKTVYRNLANALKDSSEQYRYFLLYINDDDIPELIVMNKWDAGSLYTVIDGSLVTVHSWESYRVDSISEYIPRQNSFVTHFSGNYNTYASGIQRMNPDGSMELVRSGGCNNGTYFLDGNNATESEVSNYFSEIEQNYTYLYDSYYDVDTLYSMLT